jgi:hypothetical protein
MPAKMRSVLPLAIVHACMSVGVLIVWPSCFVLQGKSIADSVNCGHYTAGVVIQRSGCQYADAERYKFP